MNTAPRPATTGRRSRVGLYLALGVGLAAVVGGAFWASRGRTTHASPRAGGHGGGLAAGVPVEVAHPRPGGLERSTTQAASVHAFEHAELFAKVSGYLQVQNVDIGDRVKLGQPLAVIEDPEIDKAVEQNEAALAQADARVGVAREKVAAAEADRAAAEAMVQQQETEVAAKVSNRDLQLKQLHRIEGLVRRNAVEARLQDEQQDRADVATADLGVARASVVTARAQVTARSALVGKAKADLAEAHADVEFARANLDKARVFQEYTRIKSPYDGVITRRSFHRGDFIRSASEGGNVPLLAVARTDMVRVVVPVPDVDVPYLDRGDAASFQVVALPGQTFRGVVSRYAETEDPQSRNMRTEVDLPNPDDRLRDGMYGRMTITLRQAVAGSLTIPSACLISQSGRGVGVVYVVRDGKAAKVEVHVTVDNGLEAEVQGGLTPEDLVITRYIGTIGEGTAVAAEMPQDAAHAAH